MNAINVDDFEALAHARLDAGAWAYFSGGAGDEITLRANRSAWNEVRIVPRVMQNMAGGHTRMELLGRRCRHPVMLAPVAHQLLAHPDGERATALAAAAQGAGFVLSAQSSVKLEEVAKLVRDEPSRGALWFQLYLQPDREFTLSIARRARDAGFEALVLTVDAAVNGARDRERRSAFRLPPEVRAVHYPTSVGEFVGGGQSRFDFAASQGTCWSDVEWLAASVGLPVIVKGVLHPEDATFAKASGAAAIIVSNHGGRTLDTALATAHALPKIVAAAATGSGSIPVLVDGGIRRGTDVLKALALGATAVLVGRPQTMALATGGAAAVAQMLRLLCDEFEIAMIQAGCRDVTSITRGLLHQ